ncbi:MAG: hypothetical protein JXB38_08670, partial [Anaerolineales bacterium]|nr:hypothetical protein [Anaerolineales bacterium]
MMNEKEIIARYNQALDELLANGQSPDPENFPPELQELLSTAQQLSQNDFSTQSNIRNSLRARLSQQSQHPIRRNNLMNGIFNSLKSFAWIGVVVLVIFTFGTVLAFALPRTEPAGQAQEAALDPPAQEQPPVNMGSGQNTKPEDGAPPEEQPPAENPPEQPSGDETEPQEPQQTGPIQLQTFGPDPEDFPAGYNPLTGLPVDDP